MSNLIHLRSESEVRSLLANKKTDRFAILYHSEWDKYSKRILSLAESYSVRKPNKRVYCISSWDIPEAFAAFQVMSAPTVVDVKGGKVVVHIEYPRVYDYFN